MANSSSKVNGWSRKYDLLCRRGEVNRFFAHGRVTTGLIDTVSDDGTSIRDDTSWLGRSGSRNGFDP